MWSGDCEHGLRLLRLCCDACRVLFCVCQVRTVRAVSECVREGRPMCVMDALLQL